jgi:hypothetical protein
MKHGCVSILPNFGRRNEPARLLQDCGRFPAVGRESSAAESKTMGEDVISVLLRVIRRMGDSGVQSDESSRQQDRECSAERNLRTFGRKHGR